MEASDLPQSLWYSLAMIGYYFGMITSVLRKEAVA
jgi:hypothetical protein